MAKPSKPDPLLDGGPTVSCAAGVDYVAGISATGEPVVPADIAAPPVPVPDAITIPLRQGRQQGRRGSNSANGTADSAYVTLDGRKLAPLLNPPPCRNEPRN